MQKLIIPAIGLALALAAPAAFAQSSSPSGTSGSASTSASGTAAHKGPMNQERLKKVLGEAGFQNVHVLDESFLVQAQTKDGDPVIMVINPPSNMSSTASSGGQSTGMSGSSGTGSSGGTGSSSSSKTGSSK